MTHPTFIIDGYGFVFRAFHVQPPLSSPSGLPVGALYGFTSMLIKVLSDFRPAAAVMVFDGSGKNFRHELYSEYKANRPPAPEELKVQFPLVRQAASALNFTILEQEGVEADDVIATIATKLAAEGKECVIISSDKDLMQLIGEYISMYDPVKNKYIKEADVFEKFGVAPAKVRDVLALIGDSSDNIPGVPSIGPKTAAELIGRFGSLHGVLEGVAEIAQEKRRAAIEGARDKALLSWELVGLKTDLDIDVAKLHWTQPDRANLINFISEYGFKSLIPRAEKLFGMDLEAGINTPPPLQLSFRTSESVSSNADPESSAHLPDLSGSCLIPGPCERGIVLDPGSRVSYASSVRGDSSLLPSLIKEAVANGKIVIYIEHDKCVVRSESVKIVMDSIAEELTEVLNNPTVLKITVNLKGLFRVISCGPVALKAFHDLALMHYATSAGNPQPNQEFFTAGNIFTKYDELKAQLYAIKAAKLYYDIDLQIASLLYKMEQAGILIDKRALDAMSAEFASEIIELEQKIYKLCGGEFNIGSPKQLGEVLFDKMKLPGAKVSSKAKTYATGVEILEHLSESGFEVADLLLRWRQISKLKNTYTDSLPKQINPETGRVHTTFIQNMTSTGRLSSMDPNLQNIPVRSSDGGKIRKAFIAKVGYKLISADYSQIELRLMSHIASIGSMQDAFRNNVDIHAATASQIFGISLADMNQEYRRKAKAINFGIIYGISAFGLAKQLGIEQKAAGEYIGSYFRTYPGIEQYMKETKEFVRAHGYVQNIFGRRHHMPAINGGNYMMRSFAERAAINAPLQGSTADIAKMAMLAVDKALTEARLDCQMLLQVHDELIFEVAEQHVDAAMPLIKKVMEGVVKLDVPLVVDISAGNNWAEIH